MISYAGLTLLLMSLIVAASVLAIFVAGALLLFVKRGRVSRH